MSNLTHFDASGQAHMVDVGHKAETRRTAVACGHIDMHADTYAVLQAGNSKKGDVLGIARLAAIQASKRTADLVPLCHPLALTHVAVTFRYNDTACRLSLVVTAETVGRTGVEMEALTAVMAGLLTVYDMLKAIDRGMRIGGIRLLEKQGGHSGHWQAETALPS